MRVIIHVECDEGGPVDLAIQAACIKAHREAPNSAFIAFSQSAPSFSQEQKFGGEIYDCRCGARYSWMRDACPSCGHMTPRQASNTTIGGSDPSNKE